MPHPHPIPPDLPRLDGSAPADEAPAVDRRAPFTAEQVPAYHDLGPWAEALMASRPPDFVIGADYMHRWWVIPRNKLANVYLHRIMHSDDDRALHDHPWANTSLVISGRYIEHTAAGSRMQEAGAIVTRQATDAHRLEILPGEHAVSLFFTGPIVREWGFHCPNGWRRWQDFVDARDKGRIGRGCGEMEDDHSAHPNIADLPA